jgi:AraC-like DNA-binding protein
MLSARTVLRREGIEIADVRCRHPCGLGRTEVAAQHAIVFVRRGSFVRSADGVEHLLEPSRGYCVSPGQEERYDHPHRGDECTAIRLQPGLLASLWGGGPSVPSTPLVSSSTVDLEHRLLLAASRRGEDPHEVVERTISLSAAALESAEPARVAAGRPATARARRALADDARVALVADPDRPLTDLAAALGASAHHLSRVFRAVTGTTIARYRMTLRAREALERLAGGERSLARLAADLGLADQSHLCRLIRSETGHTPSALRRALT